jgi:hypothetical protein
MMEPEGVSELESSHPMSCPNCGAERLGAFCHQCGQRQTDARLSISQVLQDALSNIFNLDGTVLQTIRGLTTNPGRLCHDYVAGQRARYVNPIKYCVTAIALMLIVMTLIGFEHMIPSFRPPELSERMVEVQQYAFTFVSKHLNLVIFLALPVYALVVRLLFHKAGYNLAEVHTLIFYVTGHLFLIGTVLMALAFVSPALRIAARLIIHLAYFSWAAIVFFRSKVFTGILKSVVATVVYLFVAGVIAMLISLPKVISIVREGDNLQ